MDADAVREHLDELGTEAAIERSFFGDGFDLGLLFVAGEARAAPEQARTLEALLARETEDHRRIVTGSEELFDDLDQILLAELVIERNLPLGGDDELERD